MSRRLPLPILLSCLVHLIVGFLFFFNYFAGKAKPPQNLSEAGGVVWFNLNPGGSGLGGRGGLGAPRPIDPRASLPAVTSSMPPEPTRPKPKEGTGVLKSSASLKKKAKKLKTTTFEETTAAKPPDLKENGSQAGWAGPGHGDEPGTKTGPGGGSGEGLGTGQGSGQGSGTGPGGIGKPGTGGSGSGGQNSTVLAQIRSKIVRAKRYPSQALREELEGVTGISFEISPGGSLAYVHLTKSSGHSILDNEALATVRRAAPFPYYAGPIRFSLRFDLKDSH